MARINKIISIKKEYVNKLRKMNNEVELLNSFSLSINKNEQHTTKSDHRKEFQNDYANVILDLNQLNNDLSQYVRGLENVSSEFLINFDAINMTSDSMNEDYETTSNLNLISTFMFKSDLKNKYLNDSVELIKQLRNDKMNHTTQINGIYSKKQK